METSLEPYSDSPFTGQVELAERVTPTGMTQDPYEVYLRTLDSQNSRRGQQKCLDRIATMIYREVHGEDLSPAAAELSGRCLPWWLLRYNHTTYIRSLLVDREPKYAPATINKHLAALRGVLKQCWKMQMMSTDDYMRAKDITIVKGEREPAGRNVGDDELAAMLAACEKSKGPIRWRDSALLSVLICTGVRREELAEMRIEHYDHRGRTIKIIGKGRKGRTVFIHKDTAPHLDRWLAMLGTRSGPMFPPINRNQGIYRDRHMSPAAVWRIVSRRRKAAGLAPLSTHDFRRTFAGGFLKSGGDLAQLQRLFGHASASTTARYDRRFDDGLLEAVDEMSIVVPRGEGPAEVEAS